MSTKFPEYHGHWLTKGTFEFVRSPIQYASKNFETYGDTFYGVFPIGKALMTSNPGLIRHVLQGNQKNYKKDQAYDDLGMLLGKGLVTSRGDFWRKQRRIAQPTFYKKSLEGLFLNMRELVERYSADLEGKRGQQLDMSQEMMALTARVAMKTLFSEELEGNLLEIYDCISVAQKYVSSRTFNPLSIPFSYVNGSYHKFKRKKAILDKLLFDLIEKRKQANQKESDFLQMLMDARYEDTGEPMSEQQLLDELLTIFSAGHETSANGLAWLFYLLSQHPEIVEKARAELKEKLGDRSAEVMDLKQLTYLTQVIEEGMRLYPPVWSVGREAIEEDEWEGHRIAKGTIIGAYFYHLHRHPDLWENPDEFNPERFSEEAKKARPNSHYVPFGAGPRMCIGNYFAMMEMQLILAELLRKFDFHLVPGQKIVMEPMVTLRPKYGIKMEVR